MMMAQSQGLEFVDWISSTEAVIIPLNLEGKMLSLDGYIMRTANLGETQQSIAHLSLDDMIFFSREKLYSWSTREQSSITVSGVQLNVKYRVRSQNAPQTARGLVIALNDSWSTSHYPKEATAEHNYLSFIPTTKWYDYVKIYEYANASNVFYNLHPAKIGDSYGLYDDISGAFLTNPALIGGYD